MNLSSSSFRPFPPVVFFRKLFFAHSFCMLWYRETGSFFFFGAIAFIIAVLIWFYLTRDWV